MRMGCQNGKTQRGPKVTFSSTRSFWRGPRAPQRPGRCPQAPRVQKRDFWTCMVAYSLDEALQCVPSARVASTDALQAHLRALVPLLGAWLGVHRVRAVRRARFAVYSRRDASLDAPLQGGHCRSTLIGHVT